MANEPAMASGGAARWRRVRPVMSKTVPARPTVAMSTNTTATWVTPAIRARAATAVASERVRVCERWRRPTRNAVTSPASNAPAPRAAFR